MENSGGQMKYLIVLISLTIAPFILMGQNHSQKYKVVCERTEGCPVVNGACPTCIIMMDGVKTITDAEIDAWGKQLMGNLKFLWEDSHENDPPGKEPTGWGWDGPTWKGLRVLN